MRYQAPFLRSIIHKAADHDGTGHYEIGVGIFSSEECKQGTLEHYEVAKGIPSPKMARLTIMSIVKDFGHPVVRWEEA